MTVAVQKVQGSSRSEARNAILDAAEVAFSEAGFHGVGMKALSKRAGVAQGLIHYHFGTKDGLYEAVIERRAVSITLTRSELLKQIDLSHPNAVRNIFEAFFQPPLSTEGGGTSFARVFALLVNGDERDRALVRKYYDPSALEFIEALQVAHPAADRETCAWAYSMALGLLVGAVGRSRRPERLAGKSGPDPLETEALVNRLTTHATGGFFALSENQKT